MAGRRLRGYLESILVESAKILVGDELTIAYISIEDGVIKSVSKLEPSARHDVKINAKHLIALPGMIDAHVHLRDLELSYKETFETGTRAAAVGGFTTVIDMPNSRPATITSSNLAEKMSKAEGRLYSNVAFQASLVDDANEVARMTDRGAISFKLYLNKSLVTFDSSNETELVQALEAAKRADALVTVHAEDGDRIKRLQAESLARGQTEIKDFLRAHSPQVEVYAVRKMLGLAQRLGVRLHICHITVPEAVNLVKKTSYTCEATAHHLLLNQSIFKTQKSLALCVPPIRSEMIRKGLSKLFARGKVDILASDHAPHTLNEKTKDNAWEAASGVPGLETSLPVMFTQVSKRRLSLRRLVEATSALPAKIFRLSGKGALREGYDADIVLIDPKAKLRINPQNFESKARFSPFQGYECLGTAAYTIVNGTLVAERGRIIGPAAGRVTKSDKACASS
jgi:dihydroorotase